MKLDSLALSSKDYVLKPSTQSLELGKIALRN
jgi:hypothetical protein